MRRGGERRPASRTSGGTEMRLAVKISSFVMNRFILVAACGVLFCLSCVGQSGNFIPVDDKMLQKPDPADWLMWRRTLDSWDTVR